MKDKYQNQGFNKVLNKIRAERILKYAIGTSCIELGCGEGQITKYLVERFRNVVVVDQNRNCLRYGPSNIYKICSKIEDLHQPPQNLKYDYIICSNVLEHTNNLHKLLHTIKGLGGKKSSFFFSVPNAYSTNRLVGSECGIIRTPYSLGIQDKECGHKRMYDLDSFRDLIRNHFKIIKSGTYFYKPFPNDTMIKLPKKIINKCEKLPMRYHGAEIFIVAKLK